MYIYMNRRRFLQRRILSRAFIRVCLQSLGKAIQSRNSTVICEGRFSNGGCEMASLSEALGDRASTIHKLKSKRVRAEL
jgi:hypothetical protein